MSTVASPRPSITLSSRRTSASTDTTTRSGSTQRGPGPATGSLRRNRAALRDYYGLKNAAPADARDVPQTPVLDAEEESELDKEGFEPEQYVKSLLAREGLEGVLRVEAGLVSEVRGLDGERKALVYDNYSKLIAATDTIRKMRTNMDPLTPTTSTLTPAINHIAETATTLSESLRKQGSAPDVASQTAKKQQDQQQTVRWALAAPDRIQKLVAQGRREDAKLEWEELSHLLGNWEGVEGVKALRERSQIALGDG